MLILRQTLLFFSVFGLVQAPVASISRAEAAPTKLSQEIDDVMELLPAARKGETVAELYDRLSPRMPPWMRMEFVDDLADKHTKAAPEITVKGRTATFVEGKNSAVVRIEEKGEHDLKIFLNDQEIRKSDGKTVKDLNARVVQILKAESKKNKKEASIFWRMSIPSAHAGMFDDFSWSSAAIGAVVGVIGTYFVMTSMLGYTKSSSTTATPVCTYGANECCMVSGSYVPGCCNQFAATTPGVQRVSWLSGANCVAPTTATQTSTTQSVGAGTPVYKATGLPAALSTGAK